MTRALIKYKINLLKIPKSMKNKKHLFRIMFGTKLYLIYIEFIIKFVDIHHSIHKLVNDLSSTL